MTCTEICHGFFKSKNGEWFLLARRLNSHGFEEQLARPESTKISMQSVIQTQHSIQCPKRHVKTWSIMRRDIVQDFG